jgi:hypothetical protein
MGKHTITFQIRNFEYALDVIESADILGLDFHAIASGKWFVVGHDKEYKKLRDQKIKEVDREGYQGHDCLVLEDDSKARMDDPKPSQVYVTIDMNIPDRIIRSYIFQDLDKAKDIIDSAERLDFDHDTFASGTWHRDEDIDPEEYVIEKKEVDDIQTKGNGEPYIILENGDELVYPGGIRADTRTLVRVKRPGWLYEIDNR